VDISYELGKTIEDKTIEDKTIEDKTIEDKTIEDKTIENKIKHTHRLLHLNKEIESFHVIVFNDLRNIRAVENIIDIR
jgi:hypothetical protein